MAFRVQPARRGERPTRHRPEEIYFGWQFASKAAKKLRDDAVRYYIDTLTADPDALHASFAIYRALDATIAQTRNATNGG